MTPTDRALDLLTDALCVYRITKLVTDDAVTQPWRDRIISRAYARGNPRHKREWTDAYAKAKAGDCEAFQHLATHDDCPPKAAKLVVCRWCAGVYIAAVAVAARSIARRPWSMVARTGALAAAGALIAGFEQ